MAARKLRILQVMRAPVGGLFRHVADLTRTLAESGHEIGLVVDTLANDAQTESKLSALSPFTTLGIHRFAMPRVLGKGDLTTPFAVRQLAKKLNIDIIHGHGAKGGFYARLARVAGSRAVAIYTPHGGVLHFSATSGSGRAFHLLERGLMGQTATIIFESTYAEKTYAAVIGKPTCPTKVVHNGIAPDEFIPVPPDGDAADFIYVGELRDLKGIYVLVDALAQVTRPDGAPANLAMAGDGPHRAELVARIAALGLGQRVTLLGARPARQAFARGRVAVVPSLAESLPYVVLEAAAAQLPVIATQVGGIPEIFADSTESLIAPNDPDVLAAAMQHALDQPQALAVQAAQRLIRIRQGFSLSAMSGSIEGLYTAALEKS